jgi:class 3 adenylate cyclase
MLAEDEQVAHILFMDIVGFALLPSDAQAWRVRELQTLVRSIDEVKKADAAGRLIKLARGDGMALVFFQEPLDPIRCAINLALQLKKMPSLRLRMGIHSGAVRLEKDINDAWDVSGEGIILAHRVMEPGDTGHILLSSTVGQRMEQYRRGLPIPHDLGECEIKHGGWIHLYNLYTNDFGNPAVPSRVIRDRVQENIALTKRREGDTFHVAGLKRAVAMAACFIVLLGAVYSSPAIRRLIANTFSRPSDLVTPADAAVSPSVPLGSDGTSTARLSVEDPAVRIEPDGQASPGSAAKPKKGSEGGMRIDQDRPAAPVRGVSLRVEMDGDRALLRVGIPYDKKPDREVRVSLGDAPLPAQHAVEGETLAWKLTPDQQALLPVAAKVEWAFGEGIKDTSWQIVKTATLTLPPTRPSTPPPTSTDQADEPTPEHKSGKPGGKETGGQNQSASPAEKDSSRKTGEE